MRFAHCRAITWLSLFKSIISVESGDISTRLLICCYQCDKIQISTICDINILFYRRNHEIMNFMFIKITLSS